MVRDEQASVATGHLAVLGNQDGDEAEPLPGLVYRVAGIPVAAGVLHPAFGGGTGSAGCEMPEGPDPLP